MNKQVTWVLAIVVVALIGLSVYYFQSGNQGYTYTTTTTTQTSALTTTTTTPTTTTSTTGGATIEITASGFSPKAVTVKSGDTVTWINKDSVAHWTASAVHPTHAVYPEPGGCIGSKFDACRGLAPGESWSFTFTKIGSWIYHDHLFPSNTGTIVVQ